MLFKNCGSSKILNVIFQYQTNKVSIIHDYNVGFLLRILQAIFWILFFGYSMIYKNGYQDFYGLSSSVVVKVKGIGVSDRPDIHRHIWDIADSVVPSQEMNAIFITTNAIETSNQTQGICAEDPTVYKAKCLNNSGCEKGKPLHLGNGVMTGNCVNVGHSQIKTCEIRAWCPIENDSIIKSHKPLLNEVPDFTVLIRNTIIFEELNIQRLNTFAWISGVIPKNCEYDQNHQLLKYCPIFKVSTLIGQINQTDLTDLLTHGGIIRVIITWDCNLDFSANNCKPQYTFSRIFPFSKGWNFRYATYYENNHNEFRTLFKVYGLRILIEVRGKGRRFSLVTTFMNIGSGIALASIATVICDILFTRCLHKKDQFVNYKYEKHYIQKNKTLMEMKKDEEIT